MRRCPICKNEVQEDSEDRPFCSERCRSLDLANWLDERYRLSRRLEEEDDLPSFADNNDHRKE